MDELDKIITKKINSNQKVPREFTQSIQNALYEENYKSKNKIIEFTRILATACAGVVLAGGVSFAGYEIYQKIWKNPEKINMMQAEQERIEEIQKENITEEKAKEIANQKLKELGFENETIIETDNYTEVENKKIMYRFETNNDWSIAIDGKTGEFYDLSLNKFDKSWENSIITREDAIKIAKEFYKKFGYKDGEYKLTQLRANDKEGKGNGDGYEFFAIFCKEYDGLKNNYESIHISFYAQNKQLSGYRVENKEFDNNPIEISKEKAIEIAKSEDRKNETKEITDINAEIRIEKMNGQAYARLNDTENYYGPMMKTDFPDNERYYYKTDEKVRRVWVVVFNYEDNTNNKENENKTEEEKLSERVNKGQYTYFVDCTTGEIIGGDTSDYLRWDNYWSEYYSVE